MSTTYIRSGFYLLRVSYAPYNHASFIHKENDILPFSTKWAELEDTMLSEISQTQKDKYHMFFYMWIIDFNFLYFHIYGKVEVVKLECGP